MLRDDATPTLGAFLRDRRARLDPAALGFERGRRRTPGLRREEVAHRANISPTWYTWLEQGRGGSPSADVLDRLASGLMLTEAEREHLYLLGVGHPPEPRYEKIEGVTPRLQRLLDAMPGSPAIIKTAIWDVVAWNEAAAAVLTDYSRLPRDRRNILRLIFSDERVRAAQEDWLAVARFAVGAFKADVARAGANAEISNFVDELSRERPDFAALWRESGVAERREGLKRIRHHEVGLIELEFSSFAVDGRPDLGMIVFNPATKEAAARIEGLMRARAERAAADA
ncbi:helix-turn-helix domain-containing protein [Chelatococcus sambhunathii]|uniref:Helix-turn-helix domain-containing protein n=1 Tax=Chelatococcus sambhunathii TaxID=363953 RepID=A0ABU1DG75_9HYPH|nr:helix-turn-helix transcriptional regulator [Chelatococcus sambhunathii]MDR4306905.1 helix-turn-helix domain-containing protein [Chelatococcus sambhunathii]